MLFLEVDVKMGIFPVSTAYRSGFGIFKQNRDKPDEIGMVEQSDLNLNQIWTLTFRLHTK